MFQITQIIVMNKKISKRQSFNPNILVYLWESAFLTKGALPHFFLVNACVLIIDLCAFFKTLFKGKNFAVE